MSDYMVLGPKSRSGSTPPPLEVIQAVFEGYPCRLARRRGGPIFIFAEDVLDGIGSDMTAEMRARHEAVTVSDYVKINDTVRVARLIPIREFKSLCLLNRSPRLDRYRDHVAGILEQILEKGYYVDPNFGGPVGINADLSDPFLAQQRHLAAQLQQLAAQHQQIETAYLTGKEAKELAASAHVRVDSIQAEQGDIKAKVEKAEADAAVAIEASAGLKGWRQLRPWARVVRGINLTSKEAGWEAKTFLVPLMKKRGIKKHTIPSVEFGEVGIYPEPLLHEWADDYEARKEAGRLSYPWDDKDADP